MTCTKKCCPFISICTYYSFLDNSKEDCDYENITYKQLTTCGWNNNPWHKCKEKLPPINGLLLVKECQNKYFVGNFVNKLGNNYYFRENMLNANKGHKNFRQGVEWKYVD